MNTNQVNESTQKSEDKDVELVITIKLRHQIIVLIALA